MGMCVAMSEWGHTVLYQWTHSAVSSSTSSRPCQGPCALRWARMRMSSALYSEFRASAIALSYESPLEPTEVTASQSPRACP